MMNCKNTRCKHHNPDMSCSLDTAAISIDNHGNCGGFEKGINWYINLVWNELESSNMIPINRLTEDLKIGLFFVLDIWNLQFSDCSRGSWRWIMVKESPEGPGVNYSCLKTRA